jgi:hypothetical protein
LNRNKVTLGFPRSSQPQDLQSNNSNGDSNHQRKLSLQSSREQVSAIAAKVAKEMTAHVDKLFLEELARLIMVQTASFSKLIGMVVKESKEVGIELGLIDDNVR